MSQQIIGIGAAPNDATGDTLRVAGGKINANFTELYASVGGAAVLAGSNVFTGSNSFGAAFLLPGDLTSSVLAGDQDDYNPTGLSVASAVRMDPGAADRIITGLAGGSSGRVMRLVNISTTKNLTFSSANVASASGNRFLLEGDVTLPPNGVLALYYDAQSSRWRAWGRSAVPGLTANNTWTAQNTFAAGTITTSQPLTVTQTWNAGGVTFTGLKLNVTNTASAAASLLMDLQVGGASQFSVSKAGATVAASLALGGATIGADALAVTGTANISGGVTSNGHMVLGATGNGLTVGASSNSGADILNQRAGLSLGSSAPISWTNGAIAGTADLILQRDAANTLAQRNGTNAQAFNLYETYTDASNYSRLNFQFSAAAYQIQAQAAGTSMGRALQLFGTNLSVGVGSTTVWNLNASGHQVYPTDNTFDIGAAGATRPRNVYVAGTGTFGGAVSIGNTVNVVSPALPNRTVTMVIGGTTYYLAAKTTND